LAELGAVIAITGH